MLNSERFCDQAPAQIWATLLDEGTYLASIATMYRLLRARAQVRERRAIARRPPTVKPELIATAPNQVWSRDITKLAGPDNWNWFHLYVILDIYSRHVVGSLVASHESARLAEELIADAIYQQPVDDGQLTLHADRGTSMESLSHPFVMMERDDRLGAGTAEAVVRAEGICTICKQHLLESGLTAREVTRGEFAHNVGRKKSAKSPRGLNPLPEGQRDTADNAVLLCLPCHAEIDDLRQLDLFDVEKLFELKREHEAFIRDVTARGQSQRTVVLRLRGFVRGATDDLGRDTTTKAVLASTNRSRRSPSLTGFNTEVDHTQAKLIYLDDRVEDAPQIWERVEWRKRHAEELDRLDQFDRQIDMIQRLDNVAHRSLERGLEREHGLELGL